MAPLCWRPSTRLQTSAACLAHSPRPAVPIGLLLASGVTLLITTLIGKKAYAAWGWRIPFRLIIVGVMIRHGVEEWPVFEQLQQRRSEASAPLGELVGQHTGQVVRAALVFVVAHAALARRRRSTPKCVRYASAILASLSATLLVPYWVARLRP